MLRHSRVNGLMAGTHDPSFLYTVLSQRQPSSAHTYKYKHTQTQQSDNKRQSFLSRGTEKRQRDANFVEWNGIEAPRVLGAVTEWWRAVRTTFRALRAFSIKKGLHI